MQGAVRALELSPNHVRFMPTGSEVTSSSAMSDPTKPSLPPVRADKPVADFSYVGIDAILEQMRRKALKKGFELNIMVVGES